MIIRRSEPKEKPSPVRRVVVVGLGGLILAALMNSGPILERSEQKPFGRERDVWVAVWKPVHNVAQVTFLDRPRAWLDDSLGRGSPSGGQSFLRSPALAPIVGAPPTGDIPAAASTPVAIRRPTAEAPLRVWVGGDSQAQVFGQSVVALGHDTGVMDLKLDYRISSGLTRPDYFDWPAHLASEAERLQPEVMVIVFGANDSQGIQTRAGDIYQPGEEGWRVEYRRRVAATMNLLEAPGRIQIWVGQPIAKSEDYSTRMAELNTIYREEAEKRANVRYFDSWELFTDEQGRYQAYLPDESGAIEHIRQGDDIHFTRAGGDRWARAVLRAIGAEVDIGAEYSREGARPESGR